MCSNTCQDENAQKTLCHKTNVFRYQTSILVIYRNLFAFCSLWKPSDDWSCLHVISFITALSHHKSGARTELWHLHKSSVDLNSPSSTLYDFLSKNRMTESHTHTYTLKWWCRLFAFAEGPESHQQWLPFCQSVSYLQASCEHVVLWAPSVQAQGHQTPQYMLLNSPALHLESLMDAHSRQPTVDVTITAAEKVTISGAQVSIEEGVDKGVH